MNAIVLLAAVTFGGDLPTQWWDWSPLPLPWHMNAILDTRPGSQYYAERLAKADDSTSKKAPASSARAAPGPGPTTVRIPVGHGMYWEKPITQPLPGVTVLPDATYWRWWPQQQQTGGCPGGVCPTR